MPDEQSKWTLDQTLRERAASQPDKPFLHLVGEHTQSYSEVLTSAETLAAGLKHLNVEAGHTVVSMGPNCFEVVHMWLASNLIGAIDVTINPALRGSLLEHALNLAQARVMLIDEQYLPVLLASEPRLEHLKCAIVFRAFGSPAADEYAKFRDISLVPYDDLLAHGLHTEPAPVTYRDIASVIYTSGTTGPAKGVMMPHAQTYLLAKHAVEGLRMDGDDVFYCFHPMFHMAGKFMAIYSTMIAGGKLVLDRTFQPEHWLARIRDQGATVGLAHGPMFEMIQNQPEHPDDSDNPMRRMLAAPLPKGIAVEFEQRFGIVGIEVYGMTETNVPCWRPYDEPLRVGSCGKVRTEDFEFQVVDPDSDEPLPPGHLGEFVVRPRTPWSIMQGYMGMPEKTVEAWRNFWFHTGDMGYVDEEGYVYFVDRLKDRIRRRAENISSYDIEATADTHAAVLECAAIGVPSEFEGDDDIKLCVVPKPGAKIDPIALTEFLVRQLPHYLVPRYIEIMDVLPRTPTNKVQKVKLRETGISDGTWDRKAAGISLRDLAAKAR